MATKRRVAPNRIVAIAMPRRRHLQMVTVWGLMRMGLYLSSPILNSMAQRFSHPRHRRPLRQIGSGPLHTSLRNRTYVIKARSLCAALIVIVTFP